MRHYAGTTGNGRLARDGHYPDTALTHKAVIDFAIRQRYVSQHGSDIHGSRVLHQFGDGAGLEAASAGEHDEVIAEGGVTHIGRAQQGGRLSGAQQFTQLFAAPLRYDEDWTPQLDSPEWAEAVNFYYDLITNYGPPGACRAAGRRTARRRNRGRP